MVVKGHQAKLKDPHDTTHVVISCASISHVPSSTLSTSARIRPKRC